MKAIRGRDVDTFERLEQIRYHLPHELGGPERDAFSFARLKGQAILTQSNVRVAQKRLDDFEKSRHFAKFEVDGEQWSLARVDREQRFAEREIESQRSAISAYRWRLYGGLQNPWKLRDIGEYRERSASAKESIANAREEIRSLQPIRAEVERLIAEHRSELKKTARNEEQLAQVVSRSVERETQLRVERKQELPEAQFNIQELKRLEENAITLRDPQTLRLAQREMESYFGQTQAGYESLTARAIGRAEAAAVSFQDVDTRVRDFSNNREFIPMIFQGADGKERTASVHDFQPRTLTDKLLNFFSTKDRLEMNAISQALDERFYDLLSERDSLEQFTSSAREIAKNYEQKLLSLDQNMTAGVDQRMAQQQFTVKEIAQVENFAAQQSEAGVRAQFENIARSALTTGRVIDFTELSPNAGEGNHPQLQGLDPAQIQSHRDDYLEAARNTLDKVAAKAGAEYGMLNEAAAAAESEAGSEAWALL